MATNCDLKVQPNGTEDLTDVTLSHFPVFDFQKIPYSGPFKIIEVLKKMGLEEPGKFVELLKDISNQPSLAQTMFFQRYLNRHVPEIAREIEKTAIINHQEHVGQENGVSYALVRFSPEEQDLITAHLSYMQVTQGCGGGCTKGCGVDAVPNVRDRTPLEHIVDTLEKVAVHKERKQKLKLFYASDPLEITSNNDDFFLLSEAYFELFRKPLKIVTSIPSGREELYKEICRRKNPNMDTCVSITEQNIKRLHRQGILKHDALEKLAIFPGNNPPILGVFIEGYTPSEGINLVTDDFRENVGLNGYNLPGKKHGFWDRTSLIMTPYGILNTIGIPRIDEDYPQGRIVVSVGSISEKPFKLKVGKQIEPYLRDCVVRYQDPQQSDIRSFYLSNLAGNSRVLIGKDCKIIHCENFVSDPGFAEARAI